MLLCIDNSTKGIRIVFSKGRDRSDLLKNEKVKIGEKDMYNSGKSVFNTLDGERNKSADQMHQSFLDLGVNFASGVPCGVLRHIIKNCKGPLSLDTHRGDIFALP